jgi:hypothetical protein
MLMIFFLGNDPCCHLNLDHAVVDGASHSRFNSPVSCCDVSRVHVLHTALHRLKLGSEEDGRILMIHAATEALCRVLRLDPQI